MPDQLPARVRFRDPSVLEHPVDVLKWMKKNANPKMAFKLMKCCKFFQIPEFPYFVVKEVCYDKKKWTFITLDNEKHVFESIENITKKLWITKYLFFKSKNLTSHLISKIGVCNVEMLSLINQVITYDEFQILTASGTVKDFHFFNSMVKSENGDSVFINVLFKNLPNLKCFFNHDSFYGSKVPIFSTDFVYTYKDISASKLEEFWFDIFSYNHFELFTKFMDKNPHIQYSIESCNSLSSEETKAMEKYVQRIIDDGITEYPPPYIDFHGQTEKQRYDLKLLSSKYKKQKNEK